jgi:hypothetical protein
MRTLLLSSLVQALALEIFHFVHNAYFYVQCHSQYINQLLCGRVRKHPER